MDFVICCVDGLNSFHTMDLTKCVPFHRNMLKEVQIARLSTIPVFLKLENCVLKRKLFLYKHTPWWREAKKNVSVDWYTRSLHILHHVASCGSHWYKCSSRSPALPPPPLAQTVGLYAGQNWHDPHPDVGFGPFIYLFLLDWCLNSMSTLSTHVRIAPPRLEVICVHFNPLNARHTKTLQCTIVKK